MCLLTATIAQFFISVISRCGRKGSGGKNKAFAFKWPGKLPLQVYSQHLFCFSMRQVQQLTVFFRSFPDIMEEYTKDSTQPWISDNRSPLLLIKQPWYLQLFNDRNPNTPQTTGFRGLNGKSGNFHLELRSRT